MTSVCKQVMKTKKMTVEGHSACTAQEVTPPAKKMKQARLPFQVLAASPGDSSPSPLCKSTKKKRKLSESDDDKVVKVQRSSDSSKKRQSKENLRGAKQTLECTSKLEYKKKITKGTRSPIVSSSGSKNGGVETGNKNENSCDVICISDSENETYTGDLLEKTNIHSCDGDEKSSQNVKNIISSSKNRSNNKKRNESKKIKPLSDSISFKGDTAAHTGHSENESTSECTVNLDEVASRITSVASKVAENAKQVKNGASAGRATLIKAYSAAVTRKFPENDAVIVSSENSLSESDESEIQESEGEMLKSHEFSEKDCDVKQNSLSPETSPKTPLKTTTSPGVAKTRNLTPRQLQKQLESAKKKEEKALQKQEREKKRAEEKKEKQRQMQQRKEQQRKEREEKEEQKKKEKEEKEKKRLAELELKNEEKKVKEEERKAKEEEKKVKEEERRKREEQKMQEKKLKEQAEEEVKRKKEKEAAAFTSFFLPKKSEPKQLEQQQSTRRSFRPFMVKNDMRLATMCRANLSESTKHSLECAMREQCGTELYLHELKSGKINSRHDTQTWPLRDLQDEVMIIDDDMGGMDRDNLVMESHPAVNIPRPKLLQFHENKRPPYWGTWTKMSACIGPRKPFGKEEKLFDYDVDSDDEWEEEEPGESLNGSEDEKESEDEYEVDNDFFVPHGYLSDEENVGEEEEGQSPETMKAKLKLLAIEFEMERMQKTERLKPGLIGCIWTRGTTSSTKVGEQMQQFLAAWRAVYRSDGPIVLSAPEVETSPQSPSSDAKPFSSQSSVKHRKRVKFPETALPDLVKLIHGNKNGKLFLLKEFLAHWLKLYNSENEKNRCDEDATADSTPVLSKKSILSKIKEVATWQQCPEEGAMQGQMCWYVSSEIRSALGLSDLKVSNSCWKYNLTPRRTVDGDNLNLPVSSCAATADSSLKTCSSSGQLITKFTKVLSDQERQKQLSPKAGNSEAGRSTKTKRKIIFSAADSPSRSQMSRKKMASTNLAKSHSLVKYLKSPRNSTTSKTKHPPELKSRRDVEGDEKLECIVID